MSKHEKQNTQDNQEEVQATEERKPRHENKKKRTVDAPKISSMVKRAWKAACFEHVESDSKSENKKKRLFVQKRGTPSLKQFAKGMNDASSKRWFENKKGKHNEQRSDANIKAASEARMATKQAKKKTKSSGGKPSA